MPSPRRTLGQHLGALLGLAIYLFPGVSAAPLAAAPGDTPPKLLSTANGKGGSSCSSIAELKKAADARNPKACAQYGDALLRGDGVTQDIAQGMMYLRQAAELGEPNAFFRLGKIYDDGELAPQNYAKALDYYATAAKAGVSEAQYNLGVMFASARGVKRDYVEGLAWLIVASKNGAPSDGEKQVRDQLTKTNRQTQIAAAEQRATEILKNPAAATVSNADTTGTNIPALNKSQPPAKIGLGTPTAPAKITITPTPASGPDLGKNTAISLPPPSAPAFPAPDANGKDPKPAPAPRNK